MTYIDYLAYQNELDRAAAEPEIDEIDEIESELQELAERYAEVLAKKHASEGKATPSCQDEPLQADYSLYKLRFNQLSGLVPVYDEF